MTLTHPTHCWELRSIYQRSCLIRGATHWTIFYMLSNLLLHAHRQIRPHMPTFKLVVHLNLKLIAEKEVSVLPVISSGYNEEGVSPSKLIDGKLLIHNLFKSF